MVVAAAIVEATIYAQGMNLVAIVSQMFNPGLQTFDMWCNGVAIEV
jgi:hypothetical protein